MVGLFLLIKDVINGLFESNRVLIASFIQLKSTWNEHVAEMTTCSIIALQSFSSSKCLLSTITIIISQRQHN